MVYDSGAMTLVTRTMTTTTTIPMPITITTTITTTGDKAAKHLCLDRKVAVYSSI